MRLWVLIVGLLAVLASGCRQEADDGASPSTPTVQELPALELTDDTSDLLLTWVDPVGEFHVVQEISDVPEDRREQVRVVLTTREDGTGNLLYVADLRNKDPDGKYAVKTLTRAQWDEIGASRRKARLEALKPPASAAPPPGSSATASTGKLRAIVYGADWCKPCHQAKRYLSQRGVAVTEKNIEESNIARKEMQAKLAKINKRGASIPVIDVEGQMLVGFSPSAIDRAIKAARNTKTL